MSVVHIYSGSNDNTVDKITAAGANVWSNTDHTDDVYGVAVDVDGNVYSASKDGTVQKLNSAGVQQWSFAGHTGAVWAVAVDKDGIVYSAGADGTVRKISAAGVQVWSFAGHTGAVRAVAVDKDGVVYSGGIDDTVRKISAAGVQVWSFTGHTNDVLGVAVGTDGFVYSGGADNTARKISAAGVQVWSYTGHSADVFDVAVDGSGFVYTSSFNNIRKIAADGSLEWSNVFTIWQNLRSIAIDSAGYIYTGCVDDDVRQHDLDGDEVWAYTGHSLNVNSVAVFLERRICGTVTLSAAALEDVTVRLMLNDVQIDFTTTDSNGDYTLSAIPDFDTYDVVPFRAGYSFTPEEDEVVLAGADALDIDFAAEAVNYSAWRVPGTATVEWAINEMPLQRATYRAPVSSAWMDNFGPGVPNLLSIDGNRVFGGAMEDIEWALLGGHLDQVEGRVTWKGWESILERRLVTIDDAGLDTITKFLAELNTEILQPEEMGLGTIDGGATEIDGTKYYNWTADDILDDFAGLIGGYWHIAPWPRQLSLRQYGEVAAPWALSTSVAVWNIKARYNRDEYYNRMIAIEDDDGETTEENTAQQEARSLVEGGTGIYERTIKWPAATIIAGQLAEVLDHHDDLGWEITYDTHETDMRVGMKQTVNLQDEFGTPAVPDNEMHVIRISAREEPKAESVSASRVWLFTVTLRSQPMLRGWERIWTQAMESGFWGRRPYRP